MFVYVFIFSQKLIENALSSLRAIVYTAGHKHIGALLTTINTGIWLFAISFIVSDITDDPKKIVVYAFGQLFGNYIGITIERKLNIGTNVMYLVTDRKNEEKIIDVLINNNIGLTSLNAEGIDGGEKSLMMILLKRKNKTNVEELIRSIDEFAFLVEKRPNNYVGGYVYN